MTKLPNKWIYAMYKGNQFLCEGTKEEICKQMNISKATFEFYRSTYYKNNRSSKKGNNRVVMRIQ